MATNPQDFMGGSVSGFRQIGSQRDQHQQGTKPDGVYWVDLGCISDRVDCGSLVLPKYNNRADRR